MKKMLLVMALICAIPHEVFARPSSSAILAAIARCESGSKDFDGRGRPVKNPRSSATGRHQIMFSVHGLKARKMGINLKTPIGNLRYAQYLFSTEGTRPWAASRACWGRKIATL